MSDLRLYSKLLFTAGLLFVGSVVFGQDYAYFFESAVKEGSAKELSKNFDNRVDITLGDSANNYSKSQAEIVLKDFLEKYQKRAFKVIHKGTSGGQAQYIIGSMQTESESFRTYLYIRRSDGQDLIQEIRFEKQ